MVLPTFTELVTWRKITEEVEVVSGEDALTAGQQQGQQGVPTAPGAEQPLAGVTSSQSQLNSPGKLSGAAGVRSCKKHISKRENDRCQLGLTNRDSFCCRSLPSTQKSCNIYGIWPRPYAATLAVSGLRPNPKVHLSPQLSKAQGWLLLPTVIYSTTCKYLPMARIKWRNFSPTHDF
jgi:hypothetical protein